MVQVFPDILIESLVPGFFAKPLSCPLVRSKFYREGTRVAVPSTTQVDPNNNDDVQHEQSRGIHRLAADPHERASREQRRSKKKKYS